MKQLPSILLRTLIWTIVASPFLLNPLLAQNNDHNEFAADPDEVSLAIEHYKSGNYRMALIMVKGGTRNHPRNAKLKLLGGITEMKLGHFDQAHAYFCQAIEDGMDRGAVFFKRGLCNIENQQWQWAVDDFTVAMERPDTVAQLMGLDQALEQPSHASYYRRMPYIKRAQAFAMLGDMEAAVSDINYAPSLSENLGAEFYYVRGLIQYMALHFEESIQNLEMAEKMALHLNGDFYHLYGKAALDLRNYELAIAKLSSSLELNQDQGMTRRELAIAHALIGQNAKAIELLGTNLVKEQDEGMVYFDLGYFHHRNGNPKLARKFFLKATETQSDVMEMVEQYTQLAIAPQSPIHDFNTEALKVARSYINTAAPPAKAPAPVSQTPIIEIDSVTFSPNPVPLNQAFDLVTNFRATVPYTQTAKLNFYFVVRKEGKELFRSETTEVLAKAGKLTNWTQHMKPVPKKGEYELTVYLEYLGVSDQESSVLRIE